MRFHNNSKYRKVALKAQFNFKIYNNRVLLGSDIYLCLSVKLV